MILMRPGVALRGAASVAHGPAFFRLRRDKQACSVRRRYDRLMSIAPVMSHNCQIFDLDLSNGPLLCTAECPPSAPRQVNVKLTRPKKLIHAKRYPPRRRRPRLQQLPT
jgi:hypothetical protein